MAFASLFMAAFWLCCAILPCRGTATMRCLAPRHQRPSLCDSTPASRHQLFYRRVARVKACLWRGISASSFFSPATELLPYLADITILLFVRLTRFFSPQAGGRGRWACTRG
jgi:hypothetical protein